MKEVVGRSVFCSLSSCVLDVVLVVILYQMI